jgi:exopolyphosphatase/guanosine-5'-triphosphate,3'-diphosphate pyrophosphatase
MRIAVIDLGTNSVRFDIYQLSIDNKGGKKLNNKPLHRERLMIRLGEDVFLNGYITPAAMRRTVDAFLNFKFRAELFNVTKIVAVATSAVRQAKNGSQLSALVKRRTGIELKTITGNEEARLIANGILANEKSLPKEFVLVDIGGGSTEITLCRNKKIIWLYSLPLGTARLEQIFPLYANKSLRAQGVADKRSALRNHIKSALETIPKELPIIAKKIVGSSGTLKALARISGKGKKIPKKFSSTFLKQIVEKMSRSSRLELLRIPGMEMQRLTMILGGAILLEEILNYIGAKEVQYSDHSLRDGLLQQEISLYKEKKKTSLGLHLLDLEDRLGKPLFARSYSKRVAGVAGELFDAIHKKGQINSDWRSILVSAGYLENAGKVISAEKHAEHSAYIVKHLDFPWFSKKERDCVACLCLFHSSNKIKRKDLSFLANASERTQFLKVLSLLHLSNALIWHNRAFIEIKKVAIARGKIIISIYANGSRELVALRIEARKKLFETAFRKKLGIDFC